MRFAGEGARLAAGAAVAALLIGAFFGKLAFALAALGALGVLLFFRDPERSGLADPSAVYSPADGRVVFAEAGARPHRFAPGSTVKISIFMSPLDVHVNRSPLEATVERIDHRRGRFTGAYRQDAGDVNESNSLLLRTPSGAEVVVVQIAGWLARRIVCRVQPPVRLSRGQRFGLIMFGSRVDVYLPPQARLAVREGETVRAGQTTLAWLDAAGAPEGPGESDESQAA